MIKACHRCAYKKYVGDGRYMCTHKKLQQTLAAQGVTDFRQDKMLDCCPAMAIETKKEMVGLKDPDMLTKGSTIKKISKAQVKKSQHSLF